MLHVPVSLPRHHILSVTLATQQTLDAHSSIQTLINSLSMRPAALFAFVSILGYVLGSPLTTRRYGGIEHPRATPNLSTHVQPNQRHHPMRRESSLLTSLTRDSITSYAGAGLASFLFTGVLLVTHIGNWAGRSWSRPGEPVTYPNGPLGSIPVVSSSRPGSGGSARIQSGSSQSSGKSSVDTQSVKPAPSKEQPPTQGTSGTSHGSSPVTAP